MGNPNVIDSDVSVMNAAMLAAGGLGCDLDTLEAVTVYAVALKAAGVWPFLSRLNVLVGRDFTSMKVPLIVGAGANSSDISVGFVSGDYNQATGLQGASGKYLKTGLTPANAGMTSGDGHLIGYTNVAASGAGANVLIGVQSAASTLISNLYQDTSGGTAGGRIGPNAGNTTTTVVNRLGWVGLNAVGGAMQITYNSKTLLFAPITTSGSMPTLEYFVMARNDNGTGQSLYSNGRLCMYSIGLGLTVQQTVDFYTATQALMVRLGRQYVPPFPMIPWGDSLVRGSGTTPFPSDLQTNFGRFVWNGGVGGETSSQVLTRFQADTALRAQATQVIWVGRNDILTTGQALILANIQAMIDLLAAVGNTRYIILTVPNKTTEPSGSANYNTVIALNNAIISNWGAHVWDFRTWFVAQYNQNDPTDVTNFSQDCPPSSLLTDGLLHPNTAGNLLLSNELARFSGALGYWP